MNGFGRVKAAALVALLGLVDAALIGWRFNQNNALAAARAA